MTALVTGARLAGILSPSLMLRSNMPYAHTRALSSTPARLANNGYAGTNPGELPKLGLKQLLGSNPRTRMFLALCLLTVASAEGAAWMKFGPRILGWGQDRKDEK
jgi:hypothetical protein